MARPAIVRIWITPCFHKVVRARKQLLLGAKLIAYIGSVKETRAVRQWADGERKPSAEVMRRLRIWRVGFPRNPGLGAAGNGPPTDGSLACLLEVLAHFRKDASQTQHGAGPNH